VERVQLGRSGLEVSVGGLGCGGYSRLGQMSGASEGESIALVRLALDLGVTFVDTARAYGTEEIVGKALAGHRDDVTISTKVVPHDAHGPLSAGRLRRSLEKSLSRLRTDVVDVFSLHGVTPDLYGHCVDELVPELERLRAEGKVRAVGITERFMVDTGHQMLQRALVDDCWDVLMAGFNLLNPSARDRVLPAAADRDVGVLAMFAVRRQLSDPARLRALVAELVAEGHLDNETVNAEDPLSFLVHEGGATSVVDAAYRFVRHEPGVDVTLTGTGNGDHLAQNIASMRQSPLPQTDRRRLDAMFGDLDFLSGE